MSDTETRPDDADNDETDATDTDTAETVDNPGDGQLDGNADNSKTLDDLRRLRNENAALRARTKAAEELADKAARRLHRALVESTHRLEYADDLPFDPEHLDDDTKLTAALDALLAERPGRAKRAVVGDAGQGKRGGADPGVDLLGILRGGK